MKIKFDYNNVDPQTVADVLTIFTQVYKDFKIKSDGEEIGQLEFGGINLYLTLRSSVDNTPLSISSNGQEVVWTVKPHKMTKTKQTEIYSNDSFTVYKNV